MDEGWTKYQKLVLHELERMDNDIRNLERSIINLRQDVTILKVKASMFGVIGGCIPGAVYLFMRLTEL